MYGSAVIDFAELLLWIWKKIVDILYHISKEFGMGYAILIGIVGVMVVLICFVLCFVLSIVIVSAVG